MKDIPSEFTSSLPIPKGGLTILKWVIVAAIVLFFISQTLIFVPAGFVGVIYDRGRGVLPYSLHEGLNLAIPWWQTVVLLDARLQDYTMSVVPDEGALRRDDALDAPTSDGQTVKVDVTVLFRIDADKAPQLYRTLGYNYIDKIIRPFSRSEIRMVISRYAAPEIYSEKRQEAETVMTKELTEMLKDKDIIVDKVLLRSVNFTAEYSKAIEQKVIAEQKVKQAAYEVQVASQVAQAKIAEAKGLAEAQNLQKSSLTQEFLQLEAIKKWDGKLPSAVGSAALPFLNLPIK